MKFQSQTFTTGHHSVVEVDPGNVTFQWGPIPPTLQEARLIEPEFKIWARGVLQEWADATGLPTGFRGLIDQRVTIIRPR